MKWKFFFGACLLTAVLLLQAGAPISAIAGGIAVAALLTWKNYRKDLKRRRKSASRN